MSRASVRPAQPRDEPRWRELFDAYTRFYEREPDDAIASYAWRRIHDATSPVHAVVADLDGKVVGIANYLLHESTGSMQPVCYLQDLFVDPDVRGAGVGKQMIDWLIAQMRAQRWARLYWSTRETNYRARALYDQYTPHSGFLRYVVNNPDA